MGLLHDTAEAVRDLLDAASLSLAFDASLSYDSELPLEDLDSLHVDVLAASLLQEPASRGSVGYNIGVDIAVRYRFGVADQVSTTQQIDVDSIGDYITLLEDIAEHLADPDNRVLTAVTGKPTWLRNEIRFPWVPQMLRENRQYTGIMRATYFAESDLA